MADSYKIIKNGDTRSPHVLENVESGKKISLCSCGCSKNPDGRCDGSHNKKHADKQYCSCCEE